MIALSLVIVVCCCSVKGLDDDELAARAPGGADLRPLAAPNMYIYIYIHIYIYREREI